MIYEHNLTKRDNEIIDAWEQWLSGGGNHVSAEEAELMYRQLQREEEEYRQHLEREIDFELEMVQGYHQDRPDTGFEDDDFDLPF